MKENPIAGEKIPTKDELETLWKSMWQARDKNFNEKSSW